MSLKAYPTNISYDVKLQMVALENKFGIEEDGGSNW